MDREMVQPQGRPVVACVGLQGPPRGTDGAKGVRPSTIKEVPTCSIRAVMDGA